MVTLATVARNLIVVAAFSLLAALQTFFWPILPLGFEGTLALGGVAFTLGALLSFVALMFAVITHFRHRRTRSYRALCVWSAAVLAAFVVFGSAEVWFSIFGT